MDAICDAGLGLLLSDARVALEVLEDPQVDGVHVITIGDMATVINGKSTCPGTRL